MYFILVLNTNYFIYLGLKKYGATEVAQNILEATINCVEEWCRINGLGVIHGGENALRFTPHFKITKLEIELIINIVRKALIHFN